MRRTTARHRTRRIDRKIVGWRRFIACHNRRAVIAGAELHADGGEFLAEGGEIGADVLPRRSAGSAVLLEFRRHADIADALCQQARGTGIADRDRQPLGLIAGQQMRAAPALQHGGELPCEVGGVVDAGIHAEAAGRGEQMHRVTREQYAAIGEAFGHQRHAGCPWRMRDRLDRHLHPAAGRNRAPHHLVLGFGLRIFRPHPEQELVLAVEGDDGGANVRVDRPMLKAGAVLQNIAIKRRRAQIAREHPPAEIGLLQRVFAGVTDAERPAHE